MNYKNNPGNLRFSKKNNWVGQIEPRNGFCQFESMAAGFRAMVKTIASYREKGAISLSDIISRYAPESDGNDTRKYIEIVANELNVFKDWVPSDRISCIRLATAMVKVEQSREGLNEFQRWIKNASMQTLLNICFNA